jgi:hypothetical protein
MKINKKNSRQAETAEISRIPYSQGFAALFFVLAMMTMLFLGSMGAFTAAVGYDDAISRRESRMQAGLNAHSCVSAALLDFAHDYFFTAQNQYVPDFSCTIISASRNGQIISVTAVGYKNGVAEATSSTAIDNGRSISLF